YLTAPCRNQTHCLRGTHPHVQNATLRQALTERYRVYLPLTDCLMLWDFALWWAKLPLCRVFQSYHGNSGKEYCGLARGADRYSLCAGVNHYRGDSPERH